MPRKTPTALAGEVDKLLSEFKREMPKFIVDTRKRHIPTERPPYELWPILMPGAFGVKNSTFLPLNKEYIAAYNKGWSEMLEKSFGKAEAERFKVLAPLREFIMSEYNIVDLRGYEVRTTWPWIRHRIFGELVVFELKAK